LHMTFALISSLSNRIWIPNAADMTFLRGILSHYFKKANISRFQHDNATSQIARNTVNFQGRVTSHLFIITSHLFINGLLRKDLI
jgi:hypothetical protein